MSRSSLSFKETCTEMGPELFFDKVKGVVLHDLRGFLTKVCYRHFMKTLRVIPSFGKWLSDVPFKTLAIYLRSKIV